MTDIVVCVAAALILPIKAEDSHGHSQDTVPSHWRTIAIGLALVLLILIFIMVVRDCLPRWLSSKEGSIDAEDPPISVISSKRLMPLGGRNSSSKNEARFANGKRDSKQLYLDINAAKTERERSPSISVELATPSVESLGEDAKPASPLSTEWVASSPPPRPPQTLLWVPSTARRRSVSLRGDSDDEKDEKSLCSYCGGSLYKSHSANVSPTSSLPLERRRSVTFNQSVEEIHVLSNEPQKPRSRSPSLLLSAPFYAR